MAEIQHLAEKIRRIEQDRRPRGRPVSSGLAELDRLLPQRGFRLGTLVEWFARGPASGAALLAARAAAEACRAGGALVVIDRLRAFYPPAAALLGIDLARLVVVQPQDSRDEHWAIDQSLRCEAVAAVLAWPEKPDERTLRRWQLAAEKGGALGLLVRPWIETGRASWADVRLVVEPLPGDPQHHGRRLAVEVVRCRGSAHGGCVEVWIEDAARHFEHRPSEHRPSEQEQTPAPPPRIAQSTAAGRRRSARTKTA